MARSRRLVDSPRRARDNARSLLEGYPSGQRGQTVNLLAYAFGGSNPPPSTSLVSLVVPSCAFRKIAQCFARHPCGSSSMVEPQPSKLMVRVRSPSPAPLAPRTSITTAHVAQSVEHFLGKEEVTGSIPVVSTTPAASAVSFQSLSGSLQKSCPRKNSSVRSRM